MEANGKPTSIHFVGICGVATSALAIAFHKAVDSRGNKLYKVTGSDKGFFPPVSTNLEKAGIEFYAGWHPEKMGTPDLVVVGTASGSENPETAKAHELGTMVRSDAQVRGQYFSKANAIVTAGTWGKTSSTALLTHILQEAGKQPSYVIGGIPAGLDPAALSPSTDSGQPDLSGWSVIEGDEYKSGPTDLKPKFAYLHPKFLLLSAVSWDHADVYPTEDAYFAVFEKLVEEVPETGLIVACVDHPGVRKVLGLAKCRVVRYGLPAQAGKRSTADYQYMQVGQSRDGLRFGVCQGKTCFGVESQLLGSFQAENITGCFALAKEIGIEPKIILKAIASFGGIKRRLEKRFDSAQITVIDDIAHSPEKAKAVLHELRDVYSGKIIAIFEPNIGGRSPEAATKYTDAFSGADTVIIPRLTQLKVARPAGSTMLTTRSSQPIEGKDLADLIARGHSDVQYIPNDNKLVEQVVNLAAGPLSDPSAGNVIAFLGSHGFRGMIEQVVERLSNPK